MLIDSLSILFAFTNFINIYEAIMVAFALGLLIFLTAPVTTEPDIRQPGTFYYYLQWSWLGYIKLKDAFWPFFIVLNAVLFYIDYRVEQGSYTVASWVTMHVILSMPLVYWTGAVWRCSRNCPNRMWVTASRFFIVAAYCDFALRGVIYHFYPNTLFNCQQMLIQWGDCF